MDINGVKDVDRDLMEWLVERAISDIIIQGYHVLPNGSILTMDENGAIVVRPKP